MDRRSFITLIAGGLAAAPLAAPAMAREAGASLTLDGARGALGAGAPLEMQRGGRGGGGGGFRGGGGGGFRGGGGAFRGGGGAFRGGSAFRGGAPAFRGGAYRGAWRGGGWRGGWRGGRWRGYRGGPYFYGGPYYYPYDYSWGYPYRRCWINRWGYRVCRRPLAPVVPLPFFGFW